MSAVLIARPGERRFQLEGTVQSAGAAADWACRATGLRLEDVAPRPLEPELLPLVVPAFVGLGAPWWRPRARAAIEGLGEEMGGETLLRATLLGVAQRLADNLEALREAGVEADRLRLSGALARRADLARAVCELGGAAVEVAGEESGLRGLWRWLAAAQAAADGPLEATEPAEAVYLPRWPAARHAAARAAWREAITRLFP